MLDFEDVGRANCSLNQGWIAGNDHQLGRCDVCRNVLLQQKGSTSLVYGTSDLLDLDRDEMLAALDGIAALRTEFPVLNPRASLDEVPRYVRGEEQCVPCVGAYKYFYLDWNLDVWRCEAWNVPMGFVFDLDRIPDQRKPCNACMMYCYPMPAC